MHGLKRWELDPSALIIAGMEKVGLARNVIRISPERQAERAALTQRHHPGLRHIATGQAFDQLSRHSECDSAHTASALAEPDLDGKEFDAQLHERP